MNSNARNFSLLSSLFFIAAPLYAQAPAPEQPTEITVYGANFEAPLAQVPDSVSVLNAEDIERDAATNISDLLLAAPNLNSAGASSRPRFFQIRGVGELEQYEGAPNTSVGFFLDGVDLSGLASNVSLWDINQIEVFRGPQATRFGSSALAGVINMQSTEASALSEGRVQLGGGTDNLLQAAVAAGGAIPGSDGTLTFRVSSSVLQSDGFHDNLFLQRNDSMHRDEYANRLRLNWNPASSFNANLTLINLRQDNGYDAFAIDNGFDTQSDRPGADALETNALALALNYSFCDSLRLSSLSTVSHNTLNYGYDADWGNDAFWSPYLPYDYQFDSFRTRRSLTQELRLSAGDPDTYRHGVDTRADIGVFARQLGEDSHLRELASGEAYRDYGSNYRANTLAAFGDVELPLQSGTSFQLGAREEWRFTDFNDSNAADFNFGERFWGGSASLNHDLTQNARVYLLAARGFRGGGFNQGTRITDELKRYDPEQLWNFEAGTKLNFPAYALSLNLSGFWSLRRDQQIQVSFQDDPSNPASFTYLTQNAARGRNIGTEAELTWKPTQRFNLRASGALLKATFTSVDDRIAYLDGRDQAHAPHWQYSVGPEYEIVAGLRASVTVQGRAGFSFGDDVNDQQSSSYMLTQANIRYQYRNAVLSLWAHNLFNQRYATRGFFFGNEPPDFADTLYVQQGDPRQIGATLTLPF